MDPSSSPQNPSGELHTINSSLELPTVSSCTTVEELETKFETLSDKNITPIITQQQEESTIDNVDDESDNHQMHKQNSENNLYSSSTNNSILNMIIDEDSNINPDDLLETNRRNTINIVPTHFVHKRGSQELPELVSPYRKIATTNNLKAALKNNASSSSSQKLNKSGNSASYSKFESKSSADAYKSLQILTNNQQNSQVSSPNNSESFAKYKYALENDDFSQIDFGLEVNSAQTSASEITFPVTNKQNAFYGNAQNSNANGNYFFNGQHNTASVDETIMRKNSVIDDSVSDNGELEISKHYELYLICIGDLDNCLVHKMLKTAGGQMYISNRQVSFILRNNNEKVTCTFNFYSQFNWYLMDFLKDEAKDCHGLLFMFNITHSEGWNELKQTISKKYVDVQDFVKPSIVLGTYSHSNRMPSVVNTSQVIGVVDKWKEKQIISYLEIDVEDKDECKMALTHLVTAIIQNMKDKEKENRPRRGNPIFSKICGSVSGD